jgi:hypothetical protein
MRKYGDAKGADKQLHLDGRKRAVERWAENKAGRGKKTRAKS